ncbi:hypothetical protein [Pontibacter akesuensis]|uniref:Lipoprotein n=1 Tax=Pontibacter akesuensis TaxID=388950 RepID=A0A1I7K7P4_9BACT|nr:hypothetical protein [Pontibacter akesuensis]GHA74498.1 hypothetical protein GCM10007389_30280 [Pontibacter akesuensis]SFU93411.1 hypothetical protein SAMN04487941_3479 [Pontibacter akesuensis]
MATTHFARTGSCLFLLLLCLLASCGNDGKQEDTTPLTQTDAMEAVQEEPLRTKAPAVADTANFQEAFNQFFSALQAGDTAALNSFVAEKAGVWLIEQPGAVPAYTHFSSIQAVKRSYRQLPFTSINQQVQQCQLQQRQTLPSFDCANMDQGSTGFAEDGCFYTTATEDFRNTDMWKYASLTKEQATQVQQLQQQVDVTVLHTASSYRFHFGYRNGRWHLLFADLRVPCSA